jgi:hypothetical protein
MTNLSQGLYYALLPQAFAEDHNQRDAERIARGRLHSADMADGMAVAILAD